MSSTDTTTTTISAVTVLSLLDAYSELHHQGQAQQKSCMWQLTKARQSRGRGGALVDGVLLGGDVREDLYARKMLKESEEDEATPTLCDENNDRPTTTKTKKKLSLEEQLTTKVGQFQLVDTWEEYHTKKQALNASKDKIDKKEESGLRHRKQGAAAKEETPHSAVSQWTTVDEGEGEEARLRSADPLDLFGGLPPKELRKAKEEAEKMLASYVQAANILVALQGALPTKK